jgi:hypothetical protein
VCATEPLAMSKSEGGYKKKKQPDQPRDAHCVVLASTNRDLTEDGTRPGEEIKKFSRRHPMGKKIGKGGQGCRGKSQQQTSRP